MTFNLAFMSIFLGIIASLIANYVSPYIGSALGQLFSSYRKKRQKKQNKRNKLIQELASDGTMLTLSSIRGYFFDIVFFLTFLIYLSLPPISLFNMVISLLFGLLSMICAYKGARQRKLVNEATAFYKSKLKSS